MIQPQDLVRKKVPLRLTRPTLKDCRMKGVNTANAILGTRSSSCSRQNSKNEQPLVRSSLLNPLKKYEVGKVEILSQGQFNLKHLPASMSGIHCRYFLSASLKIHPLTRIPGMVLLNPRTNCPGVYFTLIFFYADQLFALF